MCDEAFILIVDRLPGVAAAVQSALEVALPALRLHSAVRLDSRRVALVLASVPKKRPTVWGLRWYKLAIRTERGWNQRRFPKFALLSTA